MLQKSSAKEILLELTQYLFNTMKNHHYFCKHCGVRTFGVGNATPIGKMYGINVMCLDVVSDEDLAKLPITYVDGRSQRQMAKCARVLQSPVSPGATAKVRPNHPLHGRAASGAPLNGSV